ncbi:MAG: DUF1489 family protein [Alphaproteobacteria bacterium]|jgi:hypothetical protein|nr:DUF1489 family protein [Alphaproteobacteria bacterium]HJP22617.1 DUF1489 family protein [Alphaproteobacteria bacterium]
MALNLLKMCVGIDDVEQLERAHAARLDEARRQGREPRLVHRTRHTPRRAAEILDGGSLYWIIKRFVRVRQPIVAIERVVDGDGVRRCDLVLGHEWVRTEPQPRRPHQGWRYLEAADTPSDLAGDDPAHGLPLDLADNLRELGLL